MTTGFTICTICSVILLSAPCCAQSLSTPEVRSPGALTLHITSPFAQPLTMVSDALGGVRVFEVTGIGEAWLRQSLSVGIGTGASMLERVRVGNVPGIGGRGITLDMQGTSTATGLYVTGTGLTGTDDAGILLSSISNGTGTAIRIGGPQGSPRFTFGTALDIAGGTGIRYNALNAGSGTALEIGASQPPQRGIDVTTAGTDHTAVLARSNMGGTGVVGLSLSASYTDPTQWNRVGVRGHAASNSAIGADSIVGVAGTVVRGGTGGTLTRSIGVYAMAQSEGSAHSGLAVGVLASARSHAPGRHVAVAGLFNADPDNGLALVAYGGDVVLGGVDTERPALLADMPVEYRTPGATTTWTHNVRVGNVLDVRSCLVQQAQTVDDLPEGVVDGLQPAAPIIRMEASNVGSILPGATARVAGETITIVVIGGALMLANEHNDAPAEDRFLLPAQTDVILQAGESATLWYDETDHRWRLLSRSP